MTYIKISQSSKQASSIQRLRWNLKICGAKYLRIKENLFPEAYCIKDYLAVSNPCFLSSVLTLKTIALPFMKTVIKITLEYLSIYAFSTASKHLLFFWYHLYKKRLSLTCKKKMETIEWRLNVPHPHLVFNLYNKEFHKRGIINIFIQTMYIILETPLFSLQI